MPQPELLLGFSAAALLVVVIPGSSVIYVVTRSAEHGTIIGLVSVLGLETGAALHVGLSALGAATVILGAIFVILATVCDGTYAILAGRLSRRLRQSTLLRRRLSFVTAAVYLLLALMVLLV